MLLCHREEGKNMSTKTEANNRWRKKNREVLQLTITLEDKEMIRQAATYDNKSMTTYILDLVRKDMKRND